jgi:hypothetical protein
MLPLSLASVYPAPACNTKAMSIVSNTGIKNFAAFITYYDCHIPGLDGIAQWSRKERRVGNMTLVECDFSPSTFEGFPRSLATNK